MGHSIKPALVFFGNERLATGITTRAPLLQALITAGYPIALVVIAQQEARPSRKVRTQEVAEIASQHGIPVLVPHSLKDPSVIKQIATPGAVAGVLAAFGKIVPQEVLDIFPQGIINIHPSILPKHRGSTPIESVILNNEKETGVSLMRLVPQMDAGPIFAQETVLLSGTETKQGLADQLAAMGTDMLINYLPEILNGSLVPSPQNNDEASTDSRIEKSAGTLDFKEKSAAQLVREIRAFAGWPRSRALVGTTEMIITNAHDLPLSGMPGNLWIGDDQFGLHAKQGTVVIDSLIPVGKKEMPASAFLAGYQPEG